MPMSNQKFIKEVKTNKGRFLFIEITKDILDYKIQYEDKYSSMYIRSMLLPDNNPYNKTQTYDDWHFYMCLLETSRSKPTPEFEKIGTTKDLNDETLEKIVEKFEQKIGWRVDGDVSKLNSIKLYQNYKMSPPVPVTFLCNTATESLKSLIDLDDNKEYLILKVN